MNIDENILGIRFDVNGDELRNHCEKRVEYHEGRRKFYEEEEKKFAHEVDEPARTDTSKYSNSVTQSNKDRMAQSKNHHGDRARFFTFASKHLLLDHYRLRKDELQDFEMIPR